MRPWIAVAASYALVLQAMLAGMATSVSAPEYSVEHVGFVICSASAGEAAGDAPGKPPSHDAACAPCMMSASSPAIVFSGAQAHFAMTAHVVRVAPVAAALVVSSRHTPRQSRGPPTSA